MSGFYGCAVCCAECGADCSCSVTAAVVSGQRDAEFPCALGSTISTEPERQQYSTGEELRPDCARSIRHRKPQLLMGIIPAGTDSGGCSRLLYRTTTAKGLRSPSRRSRSVVCLDSARDTWDRARISGAAVRHPQLPYNHSLSDVPKGQSNCSICEQRSEFGNFHATLLFPKTGRYQKKK